jgi:hypothetical protein
METHKQQTVLRHDDMKQPALRRCARAKRRLFEIRRRTN